VALFSDRLTGVAHPDQLRILPPAQSADALLQSGSTFRPSARRIGYYLVDLRVNAKPLGDDGGQSPAMKRTRR
jgi:hypothetical protein